VGAWVSLPDISHNPPNTFTPKYLRKPQLPPPPQPHPIGMKTASTRDIVSASNQIPNFTPNFIANFVAILIDPPHPAPEVQDAVRMRPCSDNLD
jgi:hypothetical protein